MKHHTTSNRIHHIEATTDTLTGRGGLALSKVSKNWQVILMSFFGTGITREKVSGITVSLAIVAIAGLTCGVLFTHVR
jgi:hypothetical protein